MKSKKKVFTFITDIIFSIVLVALTIGTIYFINIAKSTPSLNIETIVKKKSSKVFDNNDNFVKQLTMEDYENITYEDLPDVFINALISCEDIRYFMHNGIDLPRILSALKNDVLSMSLKEGASTITQQLIKNMMLTNTKTIERKIQEMYLSFEIEKIYSKKQILEFYCNYVCFDGVNHGIQSASYKFFNKPINLITLPEAALLAGVVNAPTAYSPILHPNEALKRKNMVLKLMYQHNHISYNEMINAQQITIEDMLVKKDKDNNDETEYQYQSYLDIVYKQILKKTGYDPYTMPMEIYTYMDCALQKEIDDMQSNNSINFSISDELQQFASSIIDNNTGAIIACFGKKDYKGSKLFNYAYDRLIQPASTIKILLSYALAFEHLNYCSLEVLDDTPYKYPFSNIDIKNVDNTYMGQLTISDAIGYSRNTTAVKTLKEVVDVVGVDYVVDYLKSINMMDDAPFSYSYGLGGYTYGVSLTNLAAAYSMIARKGLYIEPLAVKKIKLLDGSNKEIVFSPYTKKVLSEETCYLLIDSLKQVMDANIWSISDCKPSGVNVFAKTGTTSFDKNTIIEKNYPTSASKDRLLASFTKDYSIACWTGYDEYLKDKQTYFLSGQNKANITKKFSKLIYQKIAKRNQSFDMPVGLKKVDIVLGTDLLATSNVDQKYVKTAIYKKNFLPTEHYKEKQITDKVQFDYFILNNEVNFVFPNENNDNKYNVIYDEEKVMGGKIVCIDVFLNNNYIYTYTTDKKIITIPIENGYYNFDIYYKYNLGLLDGVKESISFYL